ncbi:SAM-dependent chlorinase/fluorinase [cf. Phormidesmis sp. LEGE 11477]|nr:SAM-dependent chlorinase/fluorinase [cf. Phormidesmis sp. LEGE 11477]
MSITVIADYGIGDLAFSEVKQQLRKEFPLSPIDTISTHPFDTVATAFLIAQLGRNSGLRRRVLFHNCAPRKDNLKARTDNQGEKLTFARLKNNVIVIGVNSGHCLSLIKDYVTCLHEVNVSASGSQFRSRDIFPDALAKLVQGDFSLLGAEIPLETIPDIPSNCILWNDGYGNLKTSIPFESLELQPGTELSFKIGSYANKAVFVDGSFSVPDGTLAFSPGSSGWPQADGTGRLRLMELFLRGGSAWEKFGRPKTGQTITYLGARKTTDLLGWEYTYQSA